ncbi:MAG: sugar isomerase domain-containing protein [Deltaproteobacteria bacterium]|nr:sugar isomerase domain-containing protein [Deltaproteobacteria bacterium]MBW1961608.1 sugar isomerase domain-containing protein [Deltaproteobacteria bacterium]MBW1993934.1 sugar isomerase domain-containing protein [Deltaproteobacteria bacterium]MBW2150776.1 sugar isomerase domain-containing protein [Deltaproteobacteria bacterium]
MEENKEMSSYRNTIIDIFHRICGEIETIQSAAQKVAEVIAREDTVHVVGPGGHSNMAVEEVFWRAGGFACINAILDPGTNLIHGGARSMIIERTPGYGIKVLDAYRVGRKPGEVIIIANAYGINSMCIDIVEEAKKRQMTTIGITSRSYADTLLKDHPARHPSGKNLYQEVDYFLNNHLPYGDTVVELKGTTRKTGPTSTFCNVFTINLLVIETAKALLSMGVEPPLLVSGNLPGGDELNRQLIDKYIPLVKHLM